MTPAVAYVLLDGNNRRQLKRAPIIAMIANRRWPAISRLTRWPPRGGTVHLALCLTCLSADAYAADGVARPTPLAAPPIAAQLETADGAVIGTFTGRSTSLDVNARGVGAYGALGSRGYFADVLASGTLGQAVSLAYQSADCSGAPAIEQSSTVGGPLPLPGYVFAFGATEQVFYVPLDAMPNTQEIRSVQQRTAGGVRCVPTNDRAVVYPVQRNRAEVSGFVARYTAPLRVRTLTATQLAGALPANAAGRVPPLRETGAGADLPPDTPACAPGCFMPYLGDHVCEAECANSLCGFDAADCSPAFVERARRHEASLCAPTCAASDLGDGFCDMACNVSDCKFDGGDCGKP